MHTDGRSKIGTKKSLRHQTSRCSQDGQLDAAVSMAQPNPLSRMLRQRPLSTFASGIASVIIRASHSRIRQPQVPKGSSRTSAGEEQQGPTLLLGQGTEANAADEMIGSSVLRLGHLGLGLQGIVIGKSVAFSLVLDKKVLTGVCSRPLMRTHLRSLVCSYRCPGRGCCTCGIKFRRL